MENTKWILGLLCYVFFFFVLKHVLMLLLSKKQMVIAGIIMCATAVVYGLGIFAAFGAVVQIRKEKDKAYKKITVLPSDSAADELIATIKKYGCENKPNEWNKLRGVWITINESPNVSTEKKKQLKQFLMLQGLTMHYQDSKIIDNCKL